MLRSLGLAVCFYAIAGGPGYAPKHAYAENPDTMGAGPLVQNTDEGRNNMQFHYRAPGDDSLVQQHLGPGSRNSRQTAVSASPGQRPNIITQDSNGGSGSSQTAIVTGGGGNTVIQTQTGFANHQVVTQTGSGNRAVQIQRGVGKKSILLQRGHETDTQVQE